jgi:HlyD family secretion protein
MKRWAMSLGLSVILVGGGFWAMRQFQAGQAANTEVEPPAAQLKTLSALGYLEPLTENVRLSAPTSGENGQTSRVAQLMVQEGDRVKAGQVLAVLDHQGRMRAALAEAEGRLRTAQARLAQVQAGASRGEIQAQAEAIQRIAAQWQGERTAQSANLARLKAEVANAQSELDRYQSLFQSGAVSRSSLDSKLLTLQTSQAQLHEASANLSRIDDTTNQALQEAHARLDQIAEVRPVDVEVAAADVETQKAVVARARANLEQTNVRSAIAGQILKVHVRPGEVVGDDGIVELGQTGQMAAVLEVYESDIQKVRQGQTVKLYSDTMPTVLRGKVVQVGVRVQRQNVVNSDPSSNIDARVVEVRVKLDSASTQQVSALTNLQVTGEIQL